MSLHLSLKKLVVELRYKPSLAFYSQMDSIGLEMGDEFPDWERSPLTLEIRNKRHHRRLFLAHNRCFFDADMVDQAPDFDFVIKRLRKACTRLDVKSCKRTGIRQWFAADLGKTFAVMVDEFAQRFLSQDEGLLAILPDKTHDAAYVADYETADGWKYNLRMGPMLKRQWFQTVAHEPGIFEPPHDGEFTFERFRASFPDQFLYMDIDCYVEEHPVEQLDRFVGTVRSRSHDLAGKLIDRCKR